MPEHLPEPTAGDSRAPSSARQADTPARGLPGAELPPAPEEDTGLDPKRYLAAIMRYKWLIAVIAVLGTGAGFVAARFVDPIYETQSTLWIERSNTEADRGPIRSDQLLRPQAWIDLLKAYVVLDSVVREQRLYLNAGEGDDDALRTFRLNDRFTPGTYDVLIDESGREFRLLTGDGRLVDRGAVGDPIGGELGFAWRPAAEGLEAGEAIHFSVSTPRDVSRGLRAALQAEVDQSGSFMLVALKGSNPEAIASKLNAVVNRFVEVAGGLRRAKLDELTSILREQLQYAADNLQTAEAQLENFRVNTITQPAERATPLEPGIELTRDPVFSSFFEMKMEQDRIRRDRAAIERALAQGRESELPVEALEVIPTVQRSSELTDALTELTDKRAELRAMRYRYTDEHPPVRDRLEQIAVLEQRTIPRLARDLVEALRDREAVLGDRIASVGAEIREIPVRAIEEARLKRRVAIAENLYTLLQERYEEARLAAASTIPDVRILDAAMVPQDPVTNTAPQVVAVTALASIVFGLLLAVLLDRVDGRVRYPEQVTRDMGLPILGAIPYIKTARDGSMDDAMSAELVEAFRTIRLGVTHAYGAAGPIALTVSSPGIGDGKSLVAANLAISFADLGERTLLIDGDVRRGTVHRLLGSSRKPGLTDALQGDVPTKKVVHSVRASLDVIGCGARVQNAPELLNSPAMRELLGEARSNYDVVIVDSPPLGAAIDPFVLGALTGHLLMVLRTGATDRELTEAKLEMLGRLPVRILGAVLNALPSKGDYHYHRYYSYMPAYAEEEAEAEADDRGERALQGA